MRTFSINQFVFSLKHACTHTHLAHGQTWCTHSPHMLPTSEEGSSRMLWQWPLWWSWERLRERRDKASEVLRTVEASCKAFQDTICAVYFVVFQWKVLQEAWSYGTCLIKSKKCDVVKSTETPHKEDIYKKAHVKCEGEGGLKNKSGKETIKHLSNMLNCIFTKSYSRRLLSLSNLCNHVAEASSLLA